MELRDTAVRENISDIIWKFSGVFYDNADYMPRCGIEDHIIEGLAEVYIAERHIPKIDPRYRTKIVNKEIMELEFEIDYRKAFDRAYGHVAFCTTCHDRFKNESNKALSELVYGDYE